jgi:transcription initiation factor IIE alpha subunit
MNKKQQRAENLNRHYFNIAQLYQQTTVKEITQDQAKKISNKLRKLERLATIETTAQNNGYYVEPSPLDWKTGRAEKMHLKLDEDGSCPESDAKLDEIEKQVQKIFDNKLEGLFINYDSRGYALKIKADNSPLGQDWGGYYILSPEIQ